jgi:hypothetical protein
MMTGVVQEVSTKNVVTKFGEKPTYSVMVNGQWVKCGFKNPGVEVGYTVDFDGVHGKYGLETKSINIIARSSPVVPLATPTTVAAGATYPTGGYITSAVPPFKASGYSSREKVFPIPALHGDRSIVRQNALARACDLVIGSQGSKTFPLGDELTTYIISLARKFEAYTAGDIDFERAVLEESLAESATSIGQEGFLSK